MAKQPTVIVVGAGIVGASIAWHLAGGGGRGDRGRGRGTGWHRYRPFVRLDQCQLGQSGASISACAYAMAGWRRLAAAVPAIPIAWSGGLCWYLPPDELAGLRAPARRLGLRRAPGRPGRGGADRAQSRGPAGHGAACGRRGGGRGRRCRACAPAGRRSPRCPASVRHGRAGPGPAERQDRRRGDRSGPPGRRRGRDRRRGRQRRIARDGRLHHVHEHALRACSCTRAHTDGC